MKELQTKRLIQRAKFYIKDCPLSQQSTTDIDTLRMIAFKDGWIAAEAYMLMQVNETFDDMVLEVTTEDVLDTVKKVAQKE